MTRYLDLHALQTVPFANVNRDDLGSPKVVTYGGVDRIRVSSQSWKRVIRREVESRLGARAARTRLVPIKLAGKLTEQGWPADLAAHAGEQVALSATKEGLKTEDNGKTSVLLYLPEAGIDELTAICVEYRPQIEASAAKSGKEKKPVLPTARVGAVLKSRTATIDLFGRMLAELPGGKVDGAAQVAHAFTTHASDPQGDFFTAVDDWLPEDETGSGHMQTAQFSAGVFYRYATVNIDDLLRNLGDDGARARELVEAFADAFLMTLPQAKRTGTAPHTVPDLAYLAVRDGRPLSLAGAFEKPVRAGYDGGIADPSRLRLAEYAASVNRLIAARGQMFAGNAGTDDKPLDGLGDRYASFDALIAGAIDTLFAGVKGTT